jgi:site-specific recombinase XerD
MADIHAKEWTARLVKFARQFFHAAVRDKLITENPFAGVNPPAQTTESRAFFITPGMTSEVLEACPDDEWRLIVALARYGGLRIPSELHGLKWAEVDWARNRFLVHAPKTEHHGDGGQRWVPIFPELRPYLAAAFEAAADGAVFVVPGRHRNANLRTHLRRIIVKAGLTPWPKMFNNLRASRETELAEDFPMHVVTGWIGNSERVARKHYLQVTEEHFKRAAGPEGTAPGAALALHSGAILRPTVSHGESENLKNTAETSAVQQGGVSEKWESTPGRSRTCNLWLRRPLLYPVELRVHLTSSKFTV